MNNECESEYSMSALKAVLDPSAYGNILKNMQNEEIKRAGLDGLESCPNCEYAVIIENPDEKVFYCINPQCLKETCR